MKRHKSLIALSHDHHHGLRLAQLIKKGAPEYKDLPIDLNGKIKYTIESWDNELRLHFANEENILFPFVKNREPKIDQLLNEIISEHIEIKYLVEELAESSKKEDVLNRLGFKLEAHIRKEERELFPLIESVFKMELDKLEGEIISIKDSCKN